MKKTEPIQPEDVLTVDDVADLMHCSKTTAYRLMRTLRPVRLGACIRVRREDLESLIRGTKSC